MDYRFQNFTVSISKIARNIRKIKSKEMDDLGLKGVHASCLYHLYLNSNLTAKELCVLCDEDKAAISRTLEYLENNEFIVCHSKSEKRYNSPIELTEKGRNVGVKVSIKVDNILNEASIGLSEADRQVFYKALFLISDNLQNICDKYGD